MKKEIVVIILLLLSSTLIIYVVESYVFFDNSDSLISKSKLFSILFWSFVKAFVINIGLVFFYYFNKSRIKSHRNPV